MITVLPLPKDRNLIFNDTVDHKSIGELTTKLIDIAEDDEYLEKFYNIHGLTYNRKPIKIHIDSYGGQVYQCLGLLGVMKNLATPIHTVVTGCAMSCGFLMAIAGYKRFAYNHSTFMYHQLSSFSRGEIQKIEDDMMQSKRLQRMIEKHTLAYTKLTKTELQDVYEKKKDWYFNAQDALKRGVIDEII